MKLLFLPSIIINPRLIHHLLRGENKLSKLYNPSMNLGAPQLMVFLKKAHMQAREGERASPSPLALDPHKHDDFFWRTPDLD